ncbi:MAG: methionyl-tRNA formyltransferase, partial [Bacteroidota bacterium]
RIVYMGTPDFAVPALDALTEADLRPVAVVTAPDKPAGRGQRVRTPAVKEAALRHGIEVLQPADLRDPAFLDRLGALDPEILAVVAFRILPPEVYEQARLGAFNLHGSLLPAYRGAAPIQRALMDGVAETGVTTFFLQRTVDTGNVILRRRIDVGPDETGGEVHDRLSALGAEAVVETVRRIAAGTADAEPQDDALASPAPKIFREHGQVDWTQPAEAVHNHVRALDPSPGAWTMWEPAGSAGPETLKLFGSRSALGTGAPGEVIEVQDRLVVACGEGAVAIGEVQRQGKRRMDAAAFLHGADLAPGTRLGGA